MAGGGSLPDVGLYSLSAFRYLIGEEPQEVTGQITQPAGDPRFREIEDICSFTLRFPSGVFASGTSSYSLHENRHLRIMAAMLGSEPIPHSATTTSHCRSARKQERQIQSKSAASLRRTNAPLKWTTLPSACAQMPHP
jgi:predicted dehydrogenase